MAKTDPKMAIKIPQHFPFKGPPKYTQIGIFGLQIYHLATLKTILAVAGNPKCI
jgi:hypothetical protein